MHKNTSFTIKLLLSALLRRRSRMAVALFGITLGATVLLGMVTLCDDLPKQMSKEFRSYGANMVLLSSGQDKLRLADVDKAATLLPGDKLVGMTPFRYIPVRNNMVPYTAVGTDFSGIQKTSPYWRVKGAWPAKKNEALIGADIAEYARITVGKTLAIDGRNSRSAKFEAELTVVGIVKTGGVEDGFIFMRLPDMESMTDEQGYVAVAELSLNAGEKELKDLAARMHDAAPAVEARLVKRVTQSETAVLGKLALLVTLVTLVVLILTMICVATTMMTVVMERRKEIGLKKALGADNKRIAAAFLAEGLVLGIIGGLAGSVCGLLFAQFISSQVFGRSISVALYLIPATLAVSILVTVAACLLPARRAMDVEPAVVLRGE